MGKCVGRIICVLAMLVCMAAQGAAGEQTHMQVYVASGAIDSETAARLVEQLAAKYSAAQWELVEEETCGMSLRELVLADRAPQLAICSVQEAMPWAREGLLLALQTCISDQTDIALQVLDSCVYEEALYMAPLLAQHRQMAVNTELMNEYRLSYLLDSVTHPVWYPTEFQQILEEFAMKDTPALEIWPVNAQDAAAIEAMVQAIYDGYIFFGDGEIGHLDSKDLVDGVRWLRELLDCGMIARAQSREAALAHFIRGETAIFIDWTPQEEKDFGGELKKNGVRMQTIPYPASIGLPVRSYGVVGAAAFDSGDAQKNALALSAAAFVYEDEKGLLGSRAIWRDESIWLPVLEADARGMTLRSLFDDALCAVLEADADPADALRLAQAAAEAGE